MAWQWGCAYEVNLRVQGNSLVATINGQELLTAEDPAMTL
jgi:hypothetical protein